MRRRAPFLVLGVLRVCSDDLPPLCPSLPQGGLGAQVRMSFPRVDLHDVDCVWGAFTVEQLVELDHLVLQPLWSSTDEFSSVLSVCRVRVHCLVRPFLYKFAVLDPCRSCELHHRKPVVMSSQSLRQLQPLSLIGTRHCTIPFSIVPGTAMS